MLNPNKALSRRKTKHHVERRRPLGLGMESLEARRLLTLVNYYNLYDQAVDIGADEIASANAIDIQINGLVVAQGDQVVIRHAVAPGSNDAPQVFVLDTNGIYRVRHLDLDATGDPDPFGTSMALPPGLWVRGPQNQALDYLSVQVQSLNVDTREAAAGALKIHATGVPWNGVQALPGASVQWDITVPRTTPQPGELFHHDVTNVEIRVEAAFNQQTELSPEHQNIAEAFRAAIFSSSYVPGSHTASGDTTHDADQMAVYTKPGALLVARSLDTPGLLTPAGIPAGGTLRLNQTTSAPLNGDPPNISVRIADPMAAAYRAQGFITLNPYAPGDPTPPGFTNENSDNVGVWYNRTLPSNVIAAGAHFLWTLHVTASDAFNASPAIVNFGDDVVYVENTLPRYVAGIATVSDPDSVNFGSGQLTIRLTSGGTASDRLAINRQGNVSTNAGNVLFAGTVVGSFTGGVGTTPLVVTFAANATQSIVNAILQSIVYSNVSDNPTPQRIVKVQLTDGDGGVTALIKTINVTSVNDAPLLNNAPAVSLDTILEDATNPVGTSVQALVGGVTDPDVVALKGIAVIAASGKTVGHWQYSLSGGATWTELGSPTEAAARLLPADGQARVRYIPNPNINGQVQLFYRAWDQTTGTSGGTINTSGNMGGIHTLSTALETATLTITAVNDKPVLGLSGTLSYAFNAPAVVLAPGAVVSDVDSPNFDGGELRVRISIGAHVANRLNIGGGFVVEATNDVKLNGVIIGVRTSNGTGTNDLVVAFNANATKAVAQQLVRAITFKTASLASGQRKVLFSISDGDGGTSAEAEKTVNVT